jgi:hypothetical protein
MATTLSLRTPKDPEDLKQIAAENLERINDKYYNKDGSMKAKYREKEKYFEALIKETTRELRAWYDDRLAGFEEKRIQPAKSRMIDPITSPEEEQKDLTDLLDVVLKNQDEILKYLDDVVESIELLEDRLGERPAAPVWDVTQEGKPAAPATVSCPICSSTIVPVLKDDQYHCPVCSSMIADLS